jgi:hypothetical protein
MAYDPNIRASDVDRDRAATLLREHYAAGRLTPDEFAERLEGALRARNIGEIDTLLSDLPGIDLYRLPDAALTRQPRQFRARPRARGHSAAWRAAWGVWFTVTLICFVVWALSGAGYVWPLWVAGPWGAVLAGGWVTARAIRGPDRGSIGGPGQGQQRQLPGGDDLR